MTKYLVIDTRKDGLGDVFTTVCDTLDRANAEARGQWGHLTSMEKRHRKIAVYAVTESDLCGWAIDDSEIDWACYNQCRTIPGAFDSEDV